MAVDRARINRFAVAIGPIAVLVVSASTSSVRDQVGISSIGIALAVIVVAAAFVSRGAALTTAAVGALAFNFFHTKPYHSLRVDSSRDVTIVALLAVLGLVVSDINTWLRRRDTIADRRRTAVDAPAPVDHVAGDGAPGHGCLADGGDIDHGPAQPGRLPVRDRPLDHLPLIARQAGRSADGDDGFVLPAKGAALPVVSNDETIGFLILSPRRGIQSLWVERRVVIALADHLAIALTYTGHTAPRPPGDSL